MEFVEVISWLENNSVDINFAKFKLMHLKCIMIQNEKPSQNEIKFEGTKNSLKKRQNK